jgi:CheY-like chemotaxis protein
MPTASGRRAWPTLNSGPIHVADGQAWYNVNAALCDGCRGLPATAAALGADDYLQKPVEFDQLLATVRHYC